MTPRTLNSDERMAGVAARQWIVLATGNLISAMEALSDQAHEPESHPLVNAAYDAVVNAASTLQDIATSLPPRVTEDR